VEVDNLKSKASEMESTGQQSQAATQAKHILNRFDSVARAISKLRDEREDQYRDHKAYKEAYDEMSGWLNRAKEKILLLRSKPEGDRFFDIEIVKSTLASLINKKPQGALLLEKLHQYGEVSIASSSPEGKNAIKSEIKSLEDSFDSLFKEVVTQKELLDGTMQQLRDWKEELGRLTDWLQQCEILIKAAKNSNMATIEEKKKQVRDMHEVMCKLEKGKEQIDQFNQDASVLISSNLDSYVTPHLKNINSKYQVHIQFVQYHYF